MKRRGTSTRRASATTTPVPDHSRPRDRARGKVLRKIRSRPGTLVKAGRLRVCANSGSGCRLSPAWPGVSSIEIGQHPQPSTARWTP